MNVLEAVRRVTSDLPNTLTMDEAIYVRRRKFNADSMAKIAPADEADEMESHGWHLLEYVQFLQVRAIEERETPDQAVLRLRCTGLRSDAHKREIIEQVITASGAADLFNVAYDTVNDACQQGHIFAMKDKGTWIMLRDEADSRWGRR